jgi:hypothetical protein
MKAKGDYQEQVHSDEMVLVIVRQPGLHERWPKVTQGGHQAQVHSDQMFVVMARQGDWTA